MALVRSRDFGGPSWLWSALEHDKKCRDANKRRVPGKDDSEFFLEQYQPFYDAWKDPEIHDDELHYAFPATFNAATLWHNDKISSMKWLIEGYILTGESNRKIADALGEDESPSTVQIYKHLFFNVRDNNHRKSWMQQHLWTPAQQGSTKLYFVDLVYKFVGWRMGKDGLEDLFGASIDTPELQEWFVKFLMTDLMVGSLQSRSTRAKLDVGTQSILTDRLLGVINANSKKDESVDEPDDLILKLAANVKEEMKVMDVDVSQGRKELIRANMYTDEDIKNGKNAK
jgi:hypothetical protein